MNQEIPLSGGDAIINAVSGQWGVANITLSTAVASIMPSLTSSALFTQSTPEFSSNINSVMPSLTSSVLAQVLPQGLDVSVISVMPSLVSTVTLNTVEAVTLSASVVSTMPSLQSSATFYNGILTIVVGKGNNINTVVKSRNINTNTKTRYS